MSQHYVYSFYAELRDHKPKIWRRFEINGEKTMAELSIEEKETISHRGRASQNMLALIRERWLAA